MRLLLPVTVVCLALSLLAGTAAPATGQAAEEFPSGVTWQSAGDSYASGEGVFGNRGDCAQHDEAFGPAAARQLSTRGWEIVGTTFTACTGARVEDFFHRRSGDKASLWGWSLQQGGPDRVDVLTFSFGGNDVGFADVLTDCLVGVRDSWGDFLLGDYFGVSGCDISEEEMFARIDALLDPPELGCDTFRRDGGSYQCDLALEDRRGSLIDFYWDLVTSQLTNRGRLYVVDYPQVVAPTDEWASWQQLMCFGILRGDSEKLARAADRLNMAIREAVKRANQALGEERVVLIERATLFRANRAELCGAGDDWLNGLAFDRGPGWNARHLTSFHPNSTGHARTAELLADTAEATFPRGPAEADLAALLDCDEPCSISGTVDVTHPAYGPVTLVSGGPFGPHDACGQWKIIAVDQAGGVRWGAPTGDPECGIHRLAPAGSQPTTTDPNVAGAIDALGHIFFLYDGGKGDAVLVLAPTAEGFEDFGSMPDPTGFYGNLQGTELTDRDNDGIFEILRYQNNCFTSCAEGVASYTILTWDGTHYTEGPLAVPPGGRTPDQLLTTLVQALRAGDRGATRELFISPELADEIYDGFFGDTVVAVGNGCSPGVELGCAIGLTDVPALADLFVVQNRHGEWLIGWYTPIHTS